MLVQGFRPSQRGFWKRAILGVDLHFRGRPGSQSVTLYIGILYDSVKIYNDTYVWPRLSAR